MNGSHKGFAGVARRSVLFVAALGVVVTVGACENRRKKNDIAFDGVFFTTKASYVTKEKRQHFTVEVNKPSKSLEGAKEAGRYQGTQYCIENFGTSKIDWIAGPDAEPQTLRFDNDRLVFEGICKT
ncbi:hypothetical protein [Shimia sp. SDUM112013]|uniref:hypothetical protein n=1 Tax=Shimia sp. SDUM112013 TaxID=3136160 RepID=UPI0032ED974D